MLLKVYLKKNKKLKHSSKKNYRSLNTLFITQFLQSFKRSIGDQEMLIYPYIDNTPKEAVRVSSSCALACVNLAHSSFNSSFYYKTN